MTSFLRAASSFAQLREDPKPARNRPHPGGISFKSSRRGRSSRRCTSSRDVSDLPTTRRTSASPKSSPPASSCSSPASAPTRSSGCPQAGRPRVGGRAAPCWWYEASASCRDNLKGRTTKSRLTIRRILRRAHGAGAGIGRRQRREESRLARRAPAARVAPRGRVCLLRIPVGRMRLGVGDATVLDGLGKAQSLPRALIERAYRAPLLGSRAGRPDAVRGANWLSSASECRWGGRSRCNSPSG